MKFLFVENRYKTYFWETLAKHLVRSGHDVAWFVQNHAFMPCTGRVHVLPYPRAADLREPKETLDIAFIRSTDRNINFFGGNDQHYDYYQGQIDACLDREQPDVVVGESTLFHELMAVAWCRKRGIRYLHPSMLGYPNGRFSIYEGDTKIPLGGSNETPADSDCLVLAEAIRSRTAIPDYMKPPPPAHVARIHPAPRSWKDLRNVFLAYARGEHYNTPPPWRRLLRPLALARLTREWERLALERHQQLGDGACVLYPMQMQPEANLDVWGNRYRDQIALICAIADVLPAGRKLLVKANPKTKYEMSDKLIEAMKARGNIVPLPMGVPMGEVLPKAVLVVTVTGTIAVEAVISRVPLAQLGPSVTEGIRGCETITGPESLPDLLDRIASGQFPLAEDLDRIELVKRLYQTSFRGGVCDPATMPNVTLDSNVEMVAAELLKVACA
jgi:hypothetical protein